MSGKRRQFVLTALFCVPALLVTCAHGLASDAVKLTIDSGSISEITTEGTGTLYLNLDPDSIDVFARFAREHDQKRIELTLDGKVFVSPVIRGPLIMTSIPVVKAQTDEGRREIVRKVLSGEMVLEARPAQE